MLELAIGAPITIPFQWWITKAESFGDDETRRMGGMLTTPRLDRQNQYLDAAVIDGALDFSEYREFGRWNDTHWTPNGQKVTVGFPESLEFIPGKGWYTEGRLLPNVPNGGLAVERANYYWGLAKAMQKGHFDRSLGLSAEGFVTDLSECKQHILKAKVRNAAVCEVPINPDCELRILEKAFGSTQGCDCSQCLKKAMGTGDAAAMVPEDLEGAPTYNQLLAKLAFHWNVSIPEARARLDKYLRKIKRRRIANGRREHNATAAAV